MSDPPAPPPPPEPYTLPPSYPEPSRDEVYGGYATRHQEVPRPCACGTDVLADPWYPTPGVRAHNETDAHREWRRREGIE